MIPIIFPRRETRSAPLGRGWRAGRQRHRPVEPGQRSACQAPRAPARVLPRLRRLAVMVNADYSGGVIEGEQVDAAAPARPRAVPLPVRRAEDIASALDGLKGGVEALYTTGDPLMNAQRLRIITFALAARLPTMFSQQVRRRRGLMSYGPNFPDLNRRAADYVDKVLPARSRPTCPVGADQVRSRHQPDHREGARRRRAAAAARPRRRGDRMGGGGLVALPPNSVLVSLKFIKRARVGPNDRTASARRLR